LVTGNYVFEHDSADAVMELQLNSTPAPPSQATQNAISPELDSIILRCLEKDPADRPQSAMELAALLAACPRAADSTPETRSDWWTNYHSRLIVKPAASEQSMVDGHIPEVRINLESHIVRQEGEDGRSV
jgi:serine/threonine-protein kinase